MLGLLQLLKLTVYTPDLDPKDITGLDVGFEDFWRPSDLDRNREVIVRNVPALPGFAGDGRQNALTYESAPSIGVILISNASGPQRIKITAEDSRLWRALREHTGKDPLWRHFANWRNALLEELQGRAALNRAIREKVEKVFALRVSWRPAPQTPWLAPSLVWWIRVRLTQLALGNYVPHVEEEIRDTPRDGWETQSRQTLTEYLPDMKKGKEQLQNTMTAMAGRAEVEAAAQNYQDLQEKTKRVYDALEELLLIHHIAGRCGLCKKLGGQ
jgi:hypothetical protein